MERLEQRVGPGVLETFLPLLRELKQRGIENSWLVGGVTRDSILGRAPADVDIVCESDADAAALKTGGTVVGRPPFCAVNTSLVGCPVEISILTGTSIQDDLARRDFTVNAMAVDEGGNLIDPFDGAGDAERGILRFVPAVPPPCEADPVRAVRLLRFACTLGFAIEPGTESAAKKFISENRARLLSVAKERYGKEILKGFSKRPFDFLTLLESYSLLPIVLPDIEAMRGVEQPPEFHPEGDVLTHTFHVLAEAQKIIESRPSGRDEVLALAALFHDAGKPRTVQPHPKYERSCFFGHDEAGESIASRAFAAWAIPGAAASQAALLVRSHMIPGGEFTERTCVKLLRRFEGIRFENIAGHDGALPLLECLFDLALCDTRGSMGTEEKILASRKLFHQVLDNLSRAEDARSKKLLDGHDVMEILGIPPGPKVGRVLEELDAAVGEGKLRTKDEAAEWVRGFAG